MDKFTKDILERLIILINNPDNANILHELMMPILININKEFQPYFIALGILYIINILLLITILILLCNK